MQRMKSSSASGGGIFFPYLGAYRGLISGTDGLRGRVKGKPATCSGVASACEPLVSARSLRGATAKDTPVHGRRGTVFARFAASTLEHMVRTVFRGLEFSATSV